jgi:hypothetical protein
MGLLIYTMQQFPSFLQDKRAQVSDANQVTLSDCNNNNKDPWRTGVLL